VPSIRILIVEDEIIVARDLEIRLICMGYEVSGIAASGSEAIGLASSSAPDLVLMDIVLRGGIDGIEAAAEIRKRLRIPVIYLTAFTDAETLERAKVTEPFAYVVKPFSERELFANIEMALYRHRMETRIRRMESWFSTAVEGVADAVIASNSADRITTLNPAAEAITGWKRGEVIGQRLDHVLRLRNRADGSPIRFDDSLQGPQVCFAGETLLLDRNGREIPVDSTTICIRETDDRPTGKVSVFRDATGRRTEALVRLASEVAVAAGEALTLKGMLQLCCEAIVRNLGAAFARVWVPDVREDVLILRASAGMYTHLDGFHGRIPAGKFKIGRIALERKPHLTNDVPNDPQIHDPEWARREQMVAFAGHPLLIGDRLVGVLGIFSQRPLSESATDTLASVARSMAMGIERLRLEEQVQQSQRMEAIGQLAGGVAHDFNNLLTVILGYADTLLTRNDLDPGVGSRIGEIAKAGRRATALTRQLLAFSRRQLLEPRRLDLNATLKDLERMLRRTIGESIDLKTRLDPDLDPVHADAGQIEQVILNLVVNARDAMPQGGILTLDTSNVHLEGIDARLHGNLSSGDYVVMAVSDSGTGMSPEVAARVFEPFFTTKDPGKGTGLGLSTVYGIVRQSGGHTSVYSEPGLGTTFRVYLPASRGPLAKREELVEANTLPGGSETILLVEDEPAVRTIAAEILRGCGYTVLQAEDGVDGLAVFASHPGPIHLVLTDVVMPRMDGRALAARVRELRPEIPILFVSGYADDEQLTRGDLERGMAFVTKPFMPLQLARRVRELLDAGSG
jgi:PAS domain S-box-containing protein